MTKNATTANGEAMPSLNRRRLLMGLAAASAAAGVVAIQISPADGTALANLANPTDNPELVRLGDMVPATLREMLDAERDYWAVVEKWESRWPLAPEILVKPYRDSHADERGLRGAPILPTGQVYRATWEDHRDNPNLARPRAIYSLDDITRNIAKVDAYLNRKRTKRPLTAAQIMEAEAERATLSDMLAAADEYEAAKAKVLRRSGYAAAKSRVDASRDALRTLVGKVMDQPAVTMTGVIIKAEALTAWGKHPMHSFVMEAWDWPQRFAASVLSIAEQSAGREG